MGRVRGKGKRQSVASVGDENGSCEDEKASVKRRGRPQKPFSDDLEEAKYEEAVKIKESNESEEIASKNGGKNQGGVENGRKRKRASPIKENGDSVKEENGVETRMNAADLTKNVGYRQNGSRRKNKPRRAAEVGVECK